MELLWNFKNFTTMFTKKLKTAFLFFSFVFTYSFGQLKVLNNGNVGIGDSNPANTLTIYPIGQIPQRTSIWRFGIQTKLFLPSYSNVEDNGKFEVFGSYTNNSQFNADNPSLLTRLLHIKANSKLVQIGANDAVTIFNNGCVGIGQPNPTIKLEVLGSGGSDINLRVNGRISSNNPDGGLWCGESNTFMGGWA
ncbi:MAG: hypothetical protein EAZ53_00315 [Bacteroidetes bacterium]|nr:MAG: hypothetical protein EAZ53_00315 [Bacteroidota bacterium]